MTTKTAIVILSDPTTGEESLGRAFNALAVAHELDAAGNDVVVHFSGTGTRWPEVLTDPTHPLHGLFEAVRHTVKGASCGCAELFGATEGVKAGGMTLIADNAIAGTSGVASVRPLLDAGYALISF